MAWPFARLSEPFRHYWRRDGGLRSSFQAVIAFVHSPDSHTGDLKKSILSAVRIILADDQGEISAENEQLFARMVEELDDRIKISRLIDDLRNASAITPSELNRQMATLSDTERQKLFNFFLTLRVSAPGGAQGQQFLQELAQLSGVSPEEFLACETKERQNIQRRSQLLRSGAGILVAVIVILVFILTATLLRSVVFGFLAAYLLLPLEKFIERRLRQRAGIFYWISATFHLIFSPLTKLSRAITRKDSSQLPPTPEDQKKRQEKSLISRAVAHTALVVLLFIILLGMGISLLTGKYVADLGSSFREWNRDIQTENTTQLSSAPAETAQPTSKVIKAPQYLLDKLKNHFRATPWMHKVLTQLDRMVHDEKNQQELMTLLARRTGGIFSFTAGMIGTFLAFLSDLLLTIFFGLLFLLKLAEFCRDDDSNGKRSEYIVRTVFNGNWLPGANEGALAEGKRIVGGVIQRLRTWARGYITLMIIDSIVYTIMFGMLQVPYFPLLGLLCGGGILLPYIGPITGCAITTLVTLVAGDGSLFQLVGVLTGYLIYSGIIEQFILYPLVIGESMGLTTLETIIVVLLGAIFAGIPGMILALPAASVLKYLVPQIYRCWGAQHNSPTGEL